MLCANFLGGILIHNSQFTIDNARKWKFSGGNSCVPSVSHNLFFSGGNCKFPFFPKAEFGNSAEQRTWVEFPLCKTIFFKILSKIVFCQKIVCIFTAVKAQILYEKLALWLNIFFYF